MIEIDEKIALSNRKLKTSINGYNDLVSALPQKEMFKNLNNDESSIIETPNKTYHTKLINAGNAGKNNTKKSIRMKTSGSNYVTIGLMLLMIHQELLSMI